jgi:hypothetical protein
VGFFSAGAARGAGATAASVFRGGWGEAVFLGVLGAADPPPLRAGFVLPVGFAFGGLVVTAVLRGALFFAGGLGLRGGAGGFGLDAALGGVVFLTVAPLADRAPVFGTGVCLETKAFFPETKLLAFAPCLATGRDSLRTGAFLVFINNGKSRG